MTANCTMPQTAHERIAHKEVRDGVGYYFELDEEGLTFSSGRVLTNLHVQRFGSKVWLAVNIEKPEVNGEVGFSMTREQASQIIATNQLAIYPHVQTFIDGGDTALYLEEYPNEPVETTIQNRRNTVLHAQNEYLTLQFGLSKKAVRKLGEVMSNW